MDKYESLKNRLENQKYKLPPSLHTLNNWEEIITPLTGNYKIAYQILTANLLYPWVMAKNEEIYTRFGYIPYRFEVEHKNYIKSWYSILDKILRNLEKGELEKGEIIDIEELREFISYYLKKMEDIVRCRILCNYNDDMEMMDRLFQDDEFKNTLETYKIYYKNRDDKRIESGRKLEKTTHRAIHHYFVCLIDGNEYIVEVQLMTFLQEVWDIKQHIIYEMLRGGKENLELEKINQRYSALSVLLMIADEFADETRKKYIEWTKEQK